MTVTKINIPSNVRDILTHLLQSGFEAFIVGGCVRDSLLGITPKDWDITTNALPEQIKDIFDHLPDFHTVDTGIKHGTVTVIKDHTGYEVTTYRIDGEYSDNRHPTSVTFTDNISGDLARRDFTMNAIAYSPDTGFVDPYGGTEDIRLGIIRGVGNAAERFDEDALRMMRALRFSAQLDFKIEQETYSAVTQKAALIKNISIERVRDEFTKLIMTNSPQKLNDLYQCGILNLFLPQVTPDEKMLDSLKNSDQILPVRLAIIFKDTDVPNINDLLKSLTYDNNTAKTTAVILRYVHLPESPDKYPMRCLINKAGLECTKLILDFKKACGESLTAQYTALYDNILKNNDCCFIKQLAITGSDLISAGVPKGEQIGIMLERALDAVMHDPSLNQKEKLLKLLNI